MDTYVSRRLSVLVAPGEFSKVSRRLPIPLMATVRDVRHANLQRLIEELGSVQALADRLGKSHSQISQLRNRSLHSATGRERVVGDALAREIEVKLAKPVGWMDQAHAAEPAAPYETSGSWNYNVTPAPQPRGRVPLISWVQAGSWNGASDPFHPGEAERWLDCPAAHSERTYALRVRGDSMTAPHGAARTYPEGSIIFVDPLKRSPVNGQRIIAKLEGSDEVTFKVFKHEDGRVWLQPLNPMHSPIYDPFKVLGTVIGKWEDE